MDIICVQCHIVFQVKESSLDNGNPSSGLCLNCFIEYLEGKVKELKTKPNHRNRLKFVRKLLTIKLIQRQESKNGGKMK